MGLLKSIHNVSGIQYYEYRETDYWGKYKYRARIKLIGVNLLWYSKTEIDTRALNIKYDSEERKNAVVNNVPTINKLIKWSVPLKTDRVISTRIEGDTLAIFSNDLSKLQELNSIVSDLDITEVVTGEYAGVKYFARNPKHKFRIYFKSRRIDYKTRDELTEFLNKNKNIHLSKSFREWVNPKKNTWKSRWLSAGYSIDYDDESMLSYIALMYGDLLGKKFKLEKRP
jgi:hypothetical protein